METQIRARMNKLSAAILALVGFLITGSQAVAQQRNYWKEYGNKAVPVEKQWGGRSEKMDLVGIDPKLGKISCRFPGGGGEVEYLLRGLERQVKTFDYIWPKIARQALYYANEEQYDILTEDVLAQLRPVMYPLLRYLEIPNKHFKIHEECLTFIKLLIEKKLYSEALPILRTINLASLDRAGYREFSDVTLALVAKSISANPAYAEYAISLLANVQVRPGNGDDLEALLNLGDALRKNAGASSRAKNVKLELQQYGYANQVYSRLKEEATTLPPSSPVRQQSRLWPVYCYYKMYKAISPYKDEKSQKYAKTCLDAFDVQLDELNAKPPDRASNEFSLYKLLRAFSNMHKARVATIESRKTLDLVKAAQAAEDEDALEKAKADHERHKNDSKEEFENAIKEVTEGIVSSRVGLDWLPEALLMAAVGYESIQAKESADNIYRQMEVFYKDTHWAAYAIKKLSSP